MSKITNDELDPWGQVLLLKKITDMTGALHEAQVQQLKIWPLLAVPNALTSKFAWDFDLKEIYFTVTISPRMRWLSEEDTMFRLRGLDRSVKHMLGDMWRISVSVEKRVIYKSGAIGLTNGWDRTRKAKGKRKRTRRV